MTNRPDTKSLNQPDAVPPLRHLYMYLTEGCNLACRHCWLAPKRVQEGKPLPFLPMAKFETAILEAKPLGLAGVKLTGGEPLLHPRIEEMFDFIARHGLRLTMETNGVLMTPEIAAHVARFDKPFVSVSVDGIDAVTHDFIRGVSGSHERALAGIGMLVEAGIRPQIITTLMARNASQAEGMIQLARVLGAASVKFNMVQPISRGRRLHHAQDVLSVAEFLRLARQVEAKASESTDLKIYFDYPAAFRPLAHIRERNGCSACAVVEIMGVIAGGQYALCGIGEHVPELVFGEAGKDDLASVWADNKMLGELRRGLPRKLEGACGNCLMNRVCLGSCIAQTYYRTGSLWAPFWFCEEAEKEGLFPATRLRSST